MNLSHKMGYTKKMWIDYENSIKWKMNSEKE